MSRSPLCSNLLNFYTVSRLARQKFASSSESMQFYESKLMSRWPLCSNLLNFYTVSHKTQYKVSLIRATPQNPCTVYVQSACGCRHSAVICSISIPSPTKHCTKWAKSEPPRRIHAFLRVKIDVKVATVQQFVQFLYRLPPSASKNWFLSWIYVFLWVKVDVKVATLQ